MASSFRKFIKGIRVVPESASSVSEKGDLDVTSSSGKLNYHNGSSSSPVVTESHASQGTNRLQNKDLEDSTTNIVNSTDTTKKINFTASGSTNSTVNITTTASGAGTATINLPTIVAASSDTLVARNTSDTLTNKSLSDTTTAVVDVSDSTIKIKFNAAGTTGTTTTLASSQTTDRTLTLPNATDTLVAKNTSDILTNKTIDGDDNTLQDVGLSSLKTISIDANKVIRRDASGVVVSGNSLPNSSQIVTLDSSDTLTNKTLTTPVVNTSLTGGSSGTLTVQSGSNQNLSLQAQGTGIVELESLTVDSNTVTGGASTLTIQSGSNQNLSLQAQGTGVVQLESLSVTSNSITSGAGGNLALAAAASQNITLSAPTGGIVLSNKTAFSSATASFSTTTLSAPTTTYVDVTSAPSSLDMIDATGVINGQVVILTNRSGSSFTVSNLTGATAAYQIVTGTGINITFSNTASLIFIYNSTATKWYLVGGSGGGGSRAVSTVSSNTTLTNTNSVVLADSTSAAFTITLPSPVIGKEFTIKKTNNGLNAVTVATTSGTIDGQTTYLLEYQYDSITLVSDGTNFFIE